jgi:hypothetical protein
MSIALVAPLRGAAAVARKELADAVRDAVRDRRTWLTALLSAIVVGPGVMLALAGFLSDPASARRDARSSSPVPATGRRSSTSSSATAPGSSPPRPTTSGASPPVSCATR